MGRCCRHMLCKAMCHANAANAEPLPALKVPVDGKLGKETVKAVQTLLLNAGVPGFRKIDGCM